MTRVIVFDVDGTLADLTHRLHYVDGPHKDYDAFFDPEEIAKDGVIWPVAELLMLVALTTASDHKVVFCSGRPEKTRAATVKWFKDNLGFDPMHLYMRPDDDTRPDHVVKNQLLDGMREDGFEPFLVIDDRQTVVDMWRDEGLYVLQADWREHDPPGRPMLTLMVGPSGSGKTSWIKKHVTVESEFGIRADHVVGSDNTRMDLHGNITDMTKEDEVWSAVHAVVRTRLLHGLPTVVDATNIRRKARLGIVSLAPPGVPIRYVVIDRPLEDKMRDRRPEIPEWLIQKHHEVFQAQKNEILRGDGISEVTVFDERDRRIKKNEGVIE